MKLNSKIGLMLLIIGLPMTGNAAQKRAMFCPDRYVLVPTLTFGWICLRIDSVPDPDDRPLPPPRPEPDPGPNSGSDDPIVYPTLPETGPEGPGR